ncbi:MAG: AEC family transporter [Clostridiales bacterium]|nr:AEC family transporter [Clostridiales bacterium]
MEILLLAVRLGLLVMVGFIVRKIKGVDETFEKSLSWLVINVALPCLIIASINTGEFSAKELINCARTMGVAVVVLGLLFLLGQLFYLLFKKSDIGRITRFGTIFPNFTFVGLPVIQSLYGAQGVFYFMFFTLPIRLTYYSSAGPMLGGRDESQGLKAATKQFFSPPVIGVFIGLFLYITQIKLPGPLNDTVSALSSITSPLGMILCGMILGGVDIRGLLKKPAMFVLTVSKNFLAPAFVFAVLMLLPVDPFIIKISVIYCACPVASLLPTFSLKYQESEEGRAYASASMFMSMLLCVVTMPLWAGLLDLVLGA